jgi:hypothetical protein
MVLILVNIFNIPNTAHIEDTNTTHIEPLILGSGFNIPNTVWDIENSRMSSTWKIDHSLDRSLEKRVGRGEKAARRLKGVKRANLFERE